MKSMPSYVVYCCFSLIVLGLSTARAQTTDVNLPFQFSFSIEKDNYVMGEPIWAWMTVSNSSQQEIELKIQYGAENSYVFSVTNTEGFNILDPYLSMAGFYQRDPIHPGEIYSRKIFLSDYLRFTKPGIFGVLCKPTFPIETPSGTIRIEKTFGDEVEVVRDDEKLQQIINQIAGSLHDDFAVNRAGAVQLLAATRHPLALPLLTEALSDENEEIVYRAIDGISWIEGAESRSVLAEYVQEHSETRAGQYAKRLLEQYATSGGDGLSKQAE